MKNLNNYIQEKYLIDIDTDTKGVANQDKEKFSIVSDIIAKWLFEKDTYKGVKNNRLIFLKKVDNNINNLIDYFKAFGKLSEKCGFNDLADFENFVEKYNDELLEYSHNFYYDLYSEIAF